MIANSFRLSEQVFGFGVFSLAEFDGGKVVERSRNRKTLGAGLLDACSKNLSVERFRFRIACIVAGDDGKIAQTVGGMQRFVDTGLLCEKHGAAKEVVGFSQPAEAVEAASVVVHGVGGFAFESGELLEKLDGLAVEWLGFGVLSGVVEEGGEI